MDTPTSDTVFDVIAVTYSLRVPYQQLLAATVSVRSQTGSYTRGNPKRRSRALVASVHPFLRFGVKV
jgi:hypothetical protein